MNDRVFALIAGGGTGGHTYPGIALAQELVARGHAPASIRFVGARRGVEGKVVPAAGFAIDLLPGRGWQRRVTPKNLVVNLGVAAQTIVAVVLAIRLVGRYRPRVVVGFGAYASLPCVIAARLRRVPIVVHDQDAVPGLANRIGVRLGARAATSLPGTDVPGAVLTGNPVRPEFRELRRDPQVQPRLVAAYGGALGAGSINDAMVGLYDRWRARSDIAFRHVAGSRSYDEVRARLAQARRPGDTLVYELVEYEEHMDQLLGRATLTVCRAGAGTIAELTAAGMPSVLVPLPGAPGDHQQRNAQTLAAAGAAVVVEDAGCDAGRLDAILSGILADAEELTRMSDAARALARPDAAARLADLVEESAGAA